MTSILNTASIRFTRTRYLLTRVVHLSTVHRLGDPRILIREAETLAEAGYEVHVLGQGSARSPSGRVQIHELPIRTTRLSRLTLQRAAWALVRRIRPDVIHFHDPELIPMVRALRALTGARTIYDVHEDFRSRGVLSGRIVRWLEVWCFSWAENVLLAEEAYLRFAPDRSVVVLNHYRGSRSQPGGTGSGSGAPPRDVLAEHELDPEAPRPDLVLVYAGVVQADRGLETMVDMAKEIQRRELPWRVDVVGICHRASDRRRVEANLDSGPGGLPLRLIGWDRFVPYETIERCLQAADVGLVLMDRHPNYVQSIPTKFYEYLQFGLPIVCSDFDRWQAFLDRTGGAGFAVDAGDPRGIVDRIAAVTETGWRDMAGLARGAASAYRWDQTMGPRLLDVYRGLASGPAADD